MNKYSKEIKAFIQDNHKGVGPKRMAELLNKTFGTSYAHSQIKSYYANNNINSGLTGHFPKGNIPFNKGTNIGGWEPTQFKKGNRPFNYKPVGTERVNGDGYVDIKIADPNKWRGKHILTWEEHNGPLPKGHVIIFGDRNNRNFDINNLLCISRQQLLVLNRNNLIQNNAEHTKTAVLVADINIKLNERKKA